VSASSPACSSGLTNAGARQIARLLLHPTESISVSPVQEQLLRTQWPAQILEHENAAHVTVEDVLYALTQQARYEYLHDEVLQMLADKKADWVRHGFMTCMLFVVCLDVHGKP
jgi:hypothetical protein